MKFLPLLLVIFLQNCTYSQNKADNKLSQHMDTKKQDNPVYSRTDSSKVNLSEEEWKKILPQDVYYIARMKGTERP